MRQTRLGSFIESWVNIAIGFTINWCANMLILPLFGFNIKPAAAFNMGLIFTVIFIVRSYFIRRLFNKIALWHHPTTP